MKKTDSPSVGKAAEKPKWIKKKRMIAGAVLALIIALVFLYFAYGPASGNKVSKILKQYVDRADTALLNDSLETALQLYFKALDIDDRQTTLYGKIAETYFFAAQHHKQNKKSDMQNTMMNQAIFFMHQGLEIEPSNPYLEYVNGLILFERKQLDSALLFMESAETKGLSTYFLHFYLSDIYNEKENTSNCLEQLLKAYKYKPNDKKILYNLGEIYFQIGNYDKAARYQSELIEIEPDAMEIKALYAASLWKSGNEKTAKNIFNQILNDNNIMPIHRYHFVASILIDRDIDYEWGIKVAKIYADLKNDPNSFDLMGTGYYKLGKYNEAVHYLSLSYNRRPNADVKNRLELAYEKLKTQDK